MLILELLLFNIFLSDPNRGAECPVRKFTGGIELGEQPVAGGKAGFPLRGT